MSEHASPHCACGVNDAGQRYVDPICTRGGLNADSMPCDPLERVYLAVLAKGARAHRVTYGGGTNRAACGGRTFTGDFMAARDAKKRFAVEWCPRCWTVLGGTAR